ncbi:MAG: ATP-binding protein [Gaiellaceae bacterium]
MSDLLEAAVPEQAEAKRLLGAALAEGPAHAYLLHGPPGVGKSSLAVAFAAVLLGGDPGRALRRAHPDLYVLEPLGDQIRIDPIRELRRDLHMRPFEAARRVYLIFDAHLMNEDAADALLKDLEEPPDYATILLVADELGPLAETIRSRCQLIPFRRLSERAVRAELERRAPGLEPDRARAFARLAAGRLDRVERLLDPAAAARRSALLEAARAVYSEPAFDAGAAARAVLDGARERGAEAKAELEERLEGLGLPARDAEQRVRRAQRGAEREQMLVALDELSAWYRDLLVVGAGAPGAAVHADRLAQLEEDAIPERLPGSEAAAERVRALWRLLEEFNLSPALALEALFVDLRRSLGQTVPATT